MSSKPDQEPFPVSGDPNPPGRLVIISGPSGAGKSTVLRRLLETCPLPLWRSVSATTRARRPDEKDGVDYHFLSPEQFQQLRQNDAFLECEEVFGHGDWYGTLRNEVEAGLAEGKWVILEIDVGGALKVMRLCPSAISIFIHPGSLEALRTRLEKRRTETEEALQRRLETARRELAAKHHYQHEVINDLFDRAASEICDILQRH